MNTSNAPSGKPNREDWPHFEKETDVSDVKKSNKTAGYIFLFIINILILLASPILLLIGGLLQTSSNSTEKTIGPIVIILTIILIIAQVVNLTKSYKNYHKNPDRSLLRMVIPLIVLFLIILLCASVSR